MISGNGSTHGQGALMLGDFKDLSISQISRVSMYSNITGPSMGGSGIKNNTRNSNALGGKAAS